MEQTLKETLKQKLIDWIDRPPSNTDLNIIESIIDLAINYINIKNSNLFAIEYLKKSNPAHWSSRDEDTMLFILGER